MWSTSENDLLSLEIGRQLADTLLAPLLIVEEGAAAMMMSTDTLPEDH